MRTIVIPSLLLLLPLTSAACGGIAVFDPDDGTGGAGGTGSGPTSSNASVAVVASSSTGSLSCDQLLEELARAQLAARLCSPEKPVVQCDGSAILLDTCACPAIVANENLPQEVQAARNAYDSWVSAGCGPFLCADCQRPMGGTCNSAPNGEGVCDGVVLN